MNVSGQLEFAEQLLIRGGRSAPQARDIIDANLASIREAGQRIALQVLTSRNSDSPQQQVIEILQLFDSYLQTEFP